MKDVFFARALCLALGLLATVASGDDREPVLLPPVVVPAPEEEAAAPRPEAPSRKDPSGSTTVVEAASHRGEVKDAAELAATAPGVLVRDSGGLGQAKDISIRGASATGVLVLLDGVPLYGAGGLADLSLVPMAMVERVEVLRGGAGARYGSGGLGGVVNVVTPSPEGGARGGVQITAGSFGTALGNAAAAGPLGGGQGLLLLHGGLTRGDFTFPFDDRPELPGNPLVMLARENNDSAWGGALLKYHRALGWGWRANALGELSALSRGLAGTARNPSVDARQQARRGSTSVTFSRSSPETGRELSARGFLRWDEGRFSGGYFGPEGLEQTFASAGVALDAGMLLGEHALSAGIELGGDSARDSLGTNPGWLKAGFLAMDEVPLLSGLLVLAPSVRVDRIGPFTTFSPKLGVTAFLPANLELRANAGQAHRAPSFQERYLFQGNMLPNPELQPERALYADLSATWRASPGWLMLGGFYSLYEELISYEYYVSSLTRPDNIAAAAVWGLESELEVRPHPLVSGAASYTLMFSQNLRDDYRYYLHELPYRPRHRLQARLVVGPPRVRARLELAAQSRQFYNRTGDLWLAARALINAGLTVEVLSAPQVSASLELKNVLDAHVEDVDAYPLPGRAAYVTFAVALDPAGKDSSQAQRGDHHAAVDKGE